MRPLRLRHALVAAALVASPALVACGGSSDEPEGSSSSSSPAASAEESASSEPSSEPSSEASSGDGPEAYAALLTTLAGQQPAIAESDTAEEVAQNADFPDGVEVAVFDKGQRRLCIQQADPAIAIDLDPNAAIRALEGGCDGGEEVARISQDPKDPQNVLVDGDEEIGRAVERVFTEQFNG